MGKRCENRTHYTNGFIDEKFPFYSRRNIETLPIFERQLKDVRCCDGDSVRLECHVVAMPEPTVLISV